MWFYPRFPRETGCREAALLLLKEKGGRYTVVREPLLLERCVVSWDQEWDDCFELTEFTTKESYIFKVKIALYCIAECQSCSSFANQGTKSEKSKYIVSVQLCAI